MLFGVNSQTKNFHDLQASFWYTHTYMTDSRFLFHGVRLDPASVHRLVPYPEHHIFI